MDGKVPKTMRLRNKNAPKVLNSGTPEVSNHLVRMRSPVQIWVAAPQKPLKSSDLGGFCFEYAIFWGGLRISKDLVTGKMGFLQNILQFLRSSRSLKPLCHKGFRVLALQISCNCRGLCGVGTVNDCGGLADGLPALDIVA